MILAAIIGLSLLFTKRILQMHFKDWLYFLGCSLLPILVWLYFRYQRDGLDFFLNSFSVDVQDRLGAFSQNPLSYCWNYISDVSIWTKLLFFAALIGLFLIIFEKKRLNPIAIIMLLWLFIPFSVYTLSRSEYFWYIFPCYYPLLIVAGIGVGRLLRLDLSRGTMIRKKLFTIISISLASMIALTAICTNAISIYSYISNPIQYNLERFLLSKIAVEKSYEDNVAYTYSLAGSWYQRDIFVGEVICKLDCKNGGAEEFLNRGASGDILIINVVRYQELQSVLDFSCCEREVQDENYIVLRKK